MQFYDKILSILASTYKKITEYFNNIDIETNLIRCKDAEMSTTKKSSWNRFFLSSDQDRLFPSL